MKPKILFIVDRPQWAYENIAKAIIQHLSNEYDFEIRYGNEIDFINENHERWDLIFSMGWKWILPREIRTPREKTVSVLHSFRTLEGKSTEEWAEYMNARYCGVGAVNDDLHSMFNGLVQAMFRTPNGVDVHKFRPETRIPNGDGITVGWAGCGSMKFRGMDILAEAISQVEGVTARIQNADDKRIHPNEMPEFYHSLDCYANASESEGCSMTILEACASGLPVLATTTGVAHSLVVNGETGYFIRRDVGDMVEILRKLTKDKCIEMGIRMRTRIIQNGWTWDDKILGYKKLIEYGISRG